MVSTTVVRTKNGIYARIEDLFLVLFKLRHLEETKKKEGYILELK